jgi:sulfatase modifying factor 1
MVAKTALRTFLFLSLCCFLLQCAPDPEITGEDGAKMLLIPAGDFLMGGTEEELADFPRSNYLNYLGERPLHKVRISAFYMDKYEVTNARYRRFLEYLERTKDTSVDHPGKPADVGHEQGFVGEEHLGDDQPAVGLNWYDAYAYCKWAGKRLPAEAEWEYAARGQGTYRIYPWGNQEPDADGIWRANYEPASGRAADGYPYSAPVGSILDGSSPFGILDMAGNAEEWVQDWLDFGYYKHSEGAQDPRGPASGTRRVIKGGSYYADKYHIRIATRLYGAPHLKTQYQGFRCARDL